MKKKSTSISMIGFVSITIAMVMDVYEYPIFATSGLQLVFFLIVGGLLWFIPTALCSAEMATIDGWEEGGIFTWVKNTLGERFGFAAVFFQWFQVTIGFITMLYFILSAISYVFHFPQLNSNPWLKFIGIVIIYWILTFSQFGGTKNTEKFGKIGFFVGILIPAIILFCLFILYILKGNPLQFHLSKASFFPDFTKPNTLVVFISFILSYMGIEASASYVNELENPKKEYPIAMLIVVLAAILLNTIGGLSVAAVIPASKISLSGGILQALESLFATISPNLNILVNSVALMIAIGVIGEVSGWIVGPARGLYAAAQQGLLPPIFRKVNKHDVPVYLVLVQGVVVTFWAALLTFGGGGNNLSFLIAIALTVVVYLMAYLLFYIGYFVLIFKHQDLPRGYHVFGGTIGKTIIASLGLFTSIASLIISFVPPASVTAGETSIYLIILIVSALLSLALPFIIYHFNDKSIHKTIKAPKHMSSDETNKFIDLAFRGEHHIDPDKDDYL
ncbi:glutamate:gamma-aminobutyrate antiporter [Enterococcus rivorum]|uniref:Glutamate/gamma-aminobutyrate antiporter n=1 Tax=Enterococcus rivorum TaxID=762845 RepID=A0A1E5KZM5_9ENTE|nr:glutamate:gamma-aminobutyrate antiporter [Enterococcus rivorum]MBP2099273.1 glutamate:gamma-aminobutyrate antiporter [Enterococcus rivorum]OEH83347.1 glutamate:gamma-aminobutyrate antiporter [Enterococcus rivorum]